MFPLNAMKMLSDVCSLVHPTQSAVVVIIYNVGCHRDQRDGVWERIRGIDRKEWSPLLGRGSPLGGRTARSLFLALLLLGSRRRAGRCARRRVGLDQDSVFFALGAGLLRVVKLLHEVLLDDSTALLPPLLLGIRLRLDLLKPVPQHRVGRDLVC